MDKNMGNLQKSFGETVTFFQNAKLDFFY